jgi:3-methyladenine DNA glycosylase AlkD
VTTDGPDQVQAIRDEVAELADPVYAQTMQWFFKTGPGGYGEGDIFLGLKVPVARRVARGHRSASLETCRELLADRIHEHRFVALAILRGRFERGDSAERERIAALYLECREHVDNWDLVDASAPYLLAERVRRAPRTLLDPLLRSPRVWDRRIAVLATFSLVRAGEFGETLRLAEALLDDDHDLIHKAVGWMLREVGKRDERMLRQFLDRNAEAMPRTMLRYAIERMPEAERRGYMGR